MIGDPQLIEVTLHYITGKRMTFHLNDEEATHLQYCMDGAVQWFILAEQAINLSLVTMVERT